MKKRAEPVIIPLITKNLLNCKKHKQNEEQLYLKYSVAKRQGRREICRPRTRRKDIRVTGRGKIGDRRWCLLTLKNCNQLTEPINYRVIILSTIRMLLSPEFWRISELASLHQDRFGWHRDGMCKHITNGLALIFG